MLLNLWLPVLLSGVAIFFASFLSWMVLQLHRKDWLKLEKEDEFLKAATELNISSGSYMFPGCNSPAEMKTDEYKKKWEAGPCGIITVFSKVNMGRNLALTFLYFLVVNFCLAYLTILAVDPGAEFMTVFSYVVSAGFMTYFAAIVQHAIWFHNRIVGHVVEAFAYAVITGAIFAAMWPAA